MSVLVREQCWASDCRVSNGWSFSLRCRVKIASSIRTRLPEVAVAKFACGLGGRRDDDCVTGVAETVDQNRVPVDRSANPADQASIIVGSSLSDDLGANSER